MGKSLLLWFVVFSAIFWGYKQFERNPSLTPPAIQAFNDCEQSTLDGSTFVYDFSTFNSSTNRSDATITNDFPDLSLLFVLTKLDGARIASVYVPPKESVTFNIPRYKYRVEIETGYHICNASKGYLDKGSRLNMIDPIDFSNTNQPVITISPDPMTTLRLSMEDPAPEPRLSSTHQTGFKLRIPTAKDGHYYVQGEGNGFPVVFVIDTGASVVALPASMSKNMNVKRCTTVKSNTANGIVEGCMTILDKMRVGPYELEDVQAIFLPKLNTPLLGMNIMKKFSMNSASSFMEISPK